MVGILTHHQLHFNCFQVALALQRVVPSVCDDNSVQMRCLALKGVDPILSISLLLHPAQLNLLRFKSQLRLSPRIRGRCVGRTIRASQGCGIHTGNVIAGVVGKTGADLETTWSCCLGACAAGY